MNGRASWDPVWAVEFCSRLCSKDCLLHEDWWLQVLPVSRRCRRAKGFCRPAHCAGGHRAAAVCPAWGWQVDFLVNRLSALDEHMRSAEDQLALELDHRRNELVALDLWLTAVATVFSFVGMIAVGAAAPLC